MRAITGGRDASCDISEGTEALPKSDDSSDMNMIAIVACYAQL
jgi:hypothetical protein